MILSILFLSLFIYSSTMDLTAVEANEMDGSVLKTERLFDQDATPIPAKKSPEKALTEVLKKMAKYCQKLREMSVYYYCSEKIEETIYPIPDRYRGFVKTNIGIQGEFAKFHNQKSIVNHYVYDYQMIGNSDNAKEKRNLVSENGEIKMVSDAPLKTVVFDIKTIVYGPLVFEEKEQHHYQFSVKQDSENTDPNILVIQATPRPSVQKELMWGEFWIDRKNFSIHKIKLNQNSIGNFFQLEKKAKILFGKPSITIIMDYEIEKKKIRFPSHFFLEEAYLTYAGEKIILSTASIDYEDYRFFSVDVKDVKLKE